MPDRRSELQSIAIRPWVDKNFLWGWERFLLSLQTRKLGRQLPRRGPGNARATDQKRYASSTRSFGCQLLLARVSKCRIAAAHLDKIVIFTSIESAEDLLPTLFRRGFRGL